MADEEKTILLDAGVLHGAEQPVRSDDIMIVIFERLGDGILDGFQSGEMHHRRAAILRQHPLQRPLVADIALDHRKRLPADSLDALKRQRTAVGEIVEHDDLFAGR